MLPIDLKAMLDDEETAASVLIDLGIQDTSSAHQSLLSIAKHDVPLDLLEQILRELRQQLPKKPDPDMGLKNLERFIISSRSPMSLAALLVRDPTALSALLDICSFSAWLSDLLVQDPEGFDLIRLTEGQPVAKEILIEELRAELTTATGMRSAKSRLRRFKQREILRIAYGDMVRRFEPQRTSQQLSYLAESIFEISLEYCTRRMVEKFGSMTLPNGHSTGISLVASQRMGAGNLDYGSLISLFALYDRAATTKGNSKIKTADYFERLMDELQDLLGEANEFGDCYQIKFEKKSLRGNGKAHAVQDVIKYFDQSATARDRLDLVQTRYLCGDGEIAQRFLACRDQTCFRTYFGPNDLAEFQSLKRGLHRKDIERKDDNERKDIENGELEHREETGDVQPNESDTIALRNIKSGPGGIHDLEFTVNFLQLLVGRKVPDVKNGDWFHVIFELEKNGVLTQQEYSSLKENYSFLRLVSHRLQLAQQVPTDVLPKTKKLASRLNAQLRIHFGGADDFHALDRVAEVSRENLAMLSHLLQANEEETSDIFKDLVLTNEVGNQQVVDKLKDIGFRQPENAIKCIQQLSKERHRFISSKRCRFYLASIVSELIDEISRSADPDATLQSLTMVSDSLGGKGSLWELFWENRSCLQLYVDLCANTPYLASILQSNPGMLDELMDSLTVDRIQTPEEFKTELDLACGNSRDIQPVVLAMKNSKHLQIGVSQLLGKQNVRQVHEAIAAVADCCIRKITQNEFHVLVEKHGLPWIEDQDEACHFGVIIGGKIGSREPNYHSNVTFWIMYEAEGKTKAGRNQKSIFNQQFFGLLATRIAKSLSQNGPNGRLYELESLPVQLGDSKTIALSESGFRCKTEKGKGSGSLMVYLSECRPLSPNDDYSDRVRKMLNEACSSSSSSERAWSEAWKEAWNTRVQAEQGASQHNLKRGTGGTMDVETLVHFLGLRFQDKVAQSTHTPTQLEQLMRAQVLGEREGQTLSSGYELFKKIELFLRLMNLPRRHALPVVEVSGEVTDGMISGLDSADGESVQIRSSAGAEDQIKKQQERLAALLKYDRFASLREEVEAVQADTRRLVVEISGKVGLV